MGGQPLPPPARSGRRLVVAVTVWLAGMGTGALNEVVEFNVTLVLPETNVRLPDTERT